MGLCSQGPPTGGIASPIKDLFKIGGASSMVAALLAYATGAPLDVTGGMLSGAFQK
jgi:hypothetical protein